MRIRRTILYMPGNNPAMLINSPNLGADSVMLDLEDAVPIDDKDAARILVRNTLNWVNRGRTEYGVRINDITTPFWKEDLETTIPGRPDSYTIPKVECAEDLIAIHEFVTELEKQQGFPLYSIKFHPMVETAIGIENAFSIGKACPERTETLTLGGEDYVTNVCGLRSDKGDELLYVRYRVMNVARALNLQPIDIVHSHIEDMEGLVKDTRFSRQIGYAGRAVVSPRHLNIVNEIYSPSKKEIRYAQEVLDTLEEAKAVGKGAVSLYGKMIDGPMIARAEHVLALAKLIEEGN